MEVNAGLLGGWGDAFRPSTIDIDATSSRKPWRSFRATFGSLLSADPPGSDIPRPAGLRTSRPLRPRMIKPPSQAPFAPLPSGLVRTSLQPSGFKFHPSRPHLPSSAPRRINPCVSHLEKASRSIRGCLVRRDDLAVEFFEHRLPLPLHDFEKALDSKLMHRFCLEHHDVGPQILGNRHGD
jgi:hypothetical protein